MEKPVWFDSLIMPQNRPVEHYGVTLRKAATRGHREPSQGLIIILREVYLIFKRIYKDITNAQI
jgi:hypothetical protein